MALLRETPSDYLEKFILGRMRSDYQPNWDELEPETAELLTTICQRYKEGETAYVIRQCELEKADSQIGWAICMFLSRGLVEIDRDIRYRQWFVMPRYPTLARYQTHGFRPKSENGEDAVANPHRPRAINWDR